MTDSTEKSKLLQYEVLMEKIRSKNALHSKSFPELTQMIRHAIKNRKLVIDAADRLMHQRSLDLLQKAITVTTLQGLIERLECLTRQLGLKFMMAAGSNDKLFISADMFYLEIVFDKTQTSTASRRNQFVSRVSICHEGGRIDSTGGTSGAAAAAAAAATELESSPELVETLNNRDFDDFVVQLQQLMSIYDLKTTDKQVKNKVYNALVSLEDDLRTLDSAQAVAYADNPKQVVYRSPIGLLKKRRGGHPLRLHYFVSPIELLDKERGCLNEFSLDTISERALGSFVAVTIEASSGSNETITNQLPIVPIVFLNNNVASYAPLNSQNSCQLPACFSLKLKAPTPVATHLLRRIETITELKQFAFDAGERPLLGLIRATCSGMEPKSNESFVTLVDQTHCYYFTENALMNGLVIEKIKFTHPAQIAAIVRVLREQALFNSLIKTCVRVKKSSGGAATAPAAAAAIPTPENLLTFELSALSWQSISVQMQHPLLDNQLTTIEFDLSDSNGVRCQIAQTSTDGSRSAFDESLEAMATKSLRFLYSIPGTLRAILRFFRSHCEQNTVPAASLNASSGNSDGTSGRGETRTLFENRSNAGEQKTSFLAQSVMTTGRSGFDLFKTSYDSTTRHGLQPLETNMTVDDNNSSDSTAISVLSQPGNGRNATATTTTTTTTTTIGSSVRHIGDDESNNQTIRDDDDECDCDDDDDDYDDDDEEAEGDNNDNENNDNNDDDNDNDDDDGSNDGRKDGRNNNDNDDNSNNFPKKLTSNDMVSSSVSITPVAPQHSTATNMFGNDRKSTIEIIPVLQPPSTITITPVPQSTKMSLPSSSLSTKKNHVGPARPTSLMANEKKRKRRRDESGTADHQQVDSAAKLAKLSGTNAKNSVFLHSFMRNLQTSVAASTATATTTITKNNAASVTGNSNNSSQGNKDKRAITSSNTAASAAVTMPDTQQSNDRSPSTSPTKQLTGSGTATKNRKNTLSDVIDKLKSVQNPSSGTAAVNNDPNSVNMSSTSLGTLTSSTSSTVAKKPSEYMIKPSSDGMKITINKTKSKEMKSKTALTGTSAAGSSVSLNSTLSAPVKSSVSVPGQTTKLPATNSFNSSGGSNSNLTAATLNRKSTTTPPLSKSQQLASAIANSTLTGTSSTKSSASASITTNSPNTTASNQSLKSSASKSLSMINKRLTKSSSDKSIYNSVQQQQQLLLQQPLQHRRNISPKDDYAAASAATAATTTCHDPAIKMATNPVAIMLTDSLQKMNFAKNFHIPKLSARNATATTTTTTAATTPSTTANTPTNHHRDDSNLGSDSKKSI